MTVLRFFGLGKENSNGKCNGFVANEQSYIPPFAVRPQRMGHPEIGDASDGNFNRLERRLLICSTFEPVVILSSQT
jgi:hypothetical protein